MENQKHNGWTNYETWAVALWLDNEEPSYRYWRAVARDTVQICDRQNEHREEALNVLTDRLKEEIHDTLMSGVADLTSDLVASALAEVNWLEIAEHLIGEIPEKNNSPKIWNGPRPTLDADPKFPLGQTVSTPGALASVEPIEMLTAIARHHRGDWGDCCPEDWESNEEALVHGSRLLSVYHTLDEQKFWIITEWDRSLTTVLLPSEY